MFVGRAHRLLHSESGERTRVVPAPSETVALLKRVRFQIDIYRIEDRLRHDPGINGDLDELDLDLRDRDGYFKVAVILQRLLIRKIARSYSGSGLHVRTYPAPAPAGDDERYLQVAIVERNVASVTLIVVRMRRKDCVGHDAAFLTHRIQIHQHLRAATMPATAEERMMHSDDEGISGLA